jgi:potassium-dependent mechanosensitive channel
VAPEQAEPIKPTENMMADVVDKAAGYMAQARDFALQNVLTGDVAIELAVIAGCALLAYLLTGVGRQVFGRLWPISDTGRFQSTRRVVENLVTPFFWVLLLWIATSLMRNAGLENVVVRASASLLNAWVLIRLFSSLVPDPFWSKLFAATAWFVAALNILHLLDPTIAFLDAIAFEVGNIRLSVYVVLKGLLFAGLLLWIASALSRVVNAQISRSAKLTPSVQTLIGQSIRLGMLFLAVMIALSAIGIDLTAMAVFSGAVGVGIGIGLQSVFSNLVAGIIMLLERSIKVGDFVELAGGVQGTVREITIRSTLVTTNDNIDVLVPNSEFITKQMTNWTMRDAYRRLRIPFGVAYGTDKELVRKAGLEAADSVQHTLKGVSGREPQVWLVGFGDSGLEFELVIWLEPESVKRPGVVNADYCWAIESVLAKYDIEIPFPQRDLHLRSGRLPVELSGKDDNS